jgi:hypothetical protein
MNWAGIGRTPGAPIKIAESSKIKGSSRKSL